MNSGRRHSLSELAKLGFESLAATGPKLTEVANLAGLTEDKLLEVLSFSPSPDRSLDALIGLGAKDPNALGWLNTLDTGKRLVRLLGASDGLANFIQRHPVSLAFLKGKPRLVSKSEGDEISSQSQNELRISYYQLLLRIADYDLSQQSFDDVSPIMSSLSDLAGFAIESGLTLARSELIGEGRYSQKDVDASKLAVIAMGKCGARELNYLSDVDVIYVAQGEVDNYLEIATKLATRLARILDEPGDEPGLWQLDPNLRPEGKQGALVRSLEAHVSYYQRWAEAWEFQALLKARFVAGDAVLGQHYIEAIKPLIWSQPDRAVIVESARHLRKRVLDQIPAEDRDLEIKLGRGGLRDIEFTAQLMQLVHGVSDPSLRVQSTFEALDALTDAGLLSRVDREVFRRNYHFLRTLEHRVQLSKLRRTHLIPTDESELRRIARSMGFTAHELMEKWGSVRSKNAQLHDSVFYRPLLQATASLAPGDVMLSDEDVAARLRSLGFRDERGAAQHIRALTSGVSRRATIQKTLLPVLIRWMADGTDPDRALLSFRRLSESLGESHWFLGMLRDSSGAAERLMRVLSTSALIARLLEHIPDSSQWFGDEEALKPLSAQALEAEFEALIARKGKDAAELMRNVRRREYLRIAIGAVLGALTMREISDGLSSITESYLRSMLALAKHNLGIELDFCIIAMGRFGGRELGFGSDADAMFLFESDEEAGQSSAEKLASELMILVKDSLLEFEIDIDLRPEGKNGPRVRSLNGYAGYYQNWADTWEFQALLRARTISGSAELQARFTALIDPLRYPQELESKALTEIRRIKARVEAERLPQGADPARHLKLGRGSLSDVEWVTQLYQLRFASKHPELRSVQTIETLEHISRLGLADSTLVSSLIESWLLASRCRSALVLSVDKLLDVLPSERRTLESMARILEYRPGEAGILEEHYLATTRRARSAYEKLFLA